MPSSVTLTGWRALPGFTSTQTRSYLKKNMGEAQCHTCIDDFCND